MVINRMRKLMYLNIVLMGIHNPVCAALFDGDAAANVLSRPCISGSAKQEDLLQCVNKAYVLEEKKLHKSLEIALKQENAIILSHLKMSQKKWALDNYKQCNKDQEHDDGQEAVINYLDCRQKILQERVSLIQLFYICNDKACVFDEDTDWPAVLDVMSAEE